MSGRGQSSPDAKLSKQASASSTVERGEGSPSWEGHRERRVLNAQLSEVLRAHSCCAPGRHGRQSCAVTTLFSEEHDDTPACP